MNDFYKYIFITKKIIPIRRSNNKFRLLTNHLSIIVTILSLSFIIIVLSINDGYKNLIIKKIIEIDGHTRYYSYADAFNDSDYKTIKFYINSHIKEKSIVSKLITQECIIKSSDYSEGVILNALNFENKDVFNLDKFIVKGEFDKLGIIVGEYLAEDLNVSIGENVSILYYKDDNINIIEVPISGIFKSYLSNFDKHVIYADMDHLNSFLGYSSNSFESIVANIDNHYINNSDILTIDDTNTYSINWSDRHEEFINWLFSYDIPIKILLFFIFLVSLINTISSIYIDIVNRKQDNSMLFILGLNVKQIKYIYIMKNTILSSIASIASILISLIILYLFKNYNIIIIPSDIYFTNSIPISYKYYNFIIVIPFILLTTFFTTFITFNKNNLKHLMRK